jgi:hypothetical protein
MHKKDVNHIERVRETIRKKEMAMTTEQRINLLFKQMDFAYILSKFRKLQPAKKDDIQWIELRLKSHKKFK